MPFFCALPNWDAFFWVLSTLNSLNIIFMRSSGLRCSFWGVLYLKSVIVSTIHLALEPCARRRHLKLKLQLPKLDPFSLHLSFSFRYLFCFFSIGLEIELNLMKIYHFVNYKWLHLSKTYIWLNSCNLSV